MRGGLRKDGDFVEVTVNDTDPYHVVVEKACECLNLQFDSQHTLFLAHVSGTRIRDAHINGGPGYSQPWTMGRYVRHSFSRNTNIKLGVVKVEEVS